MPNNEQLALLTVSALVSLYNEGVSDYNPAGFDPVTGFKSKRVAIERIESMCASGNLAVAFDGDSAVIIDATPAPEALPEGPGGDDEADEGAGDEGEADEGEADEGEADEGEDDAPIAAYGDGKGEVAKSGFRYGSEGWLKANPRGTSAREAYRKARRKAARMTRKAARAAKHNVNA
jgi:hypothetical protein